MKKQFLIFLFLGCSFFMRAQITSKNLEQFPVFPDCENLTSKNLEACFYAQVQDFVYVNFKIPENLTQKDYKGSCIVLFEVDDQGMFKVLYVDAVDQQLVNESNRVFGLFPKIKPPTYNGKPTYSKYTIKIAIPLKSAADLAAEVEAVAQEDAVNYAKTRNLELKEYDSIVYHKFNNPKFESDLNIPLSHSYYAQFDPAMNQLGANNHTASKPFTYSEVSKYYSLRLENDKLMKDKKTWGGRKLWNENLVQIQGEGYWFTLNAIFDLQVGKSTASDFSSTFINTRALQIQGGLGKDLNFTTTIYESQGRFAEYFNQYAESIGADGEEYNAIVPGIGITKPFKSDAYDMPFAESNITYAPGKIFNFQLGYGRNFIGDGYRSILMTDGVSPYPYFKINTTFWKIKYTNIYTTLKDVSPEAISENTYATKYMANHYLSWNASKKLNIGFFESVIWANTNDRGFDMSFLNPIIFYRSVEFASSQETGNALLGFTAKYKWNNQFNLYSQFLLDEFSLNDMKSGNKSWKNKYGYQLGVKYFNAFNVTNLLLQVEYNAVRPYMYSHSAVITNYGNTNQNMGHQWGGNFREGILLGYYFKGRYFANAKITYGIRGLDFNTPTDSLNYGGNIYRDYDDDRAYDYGVKIGQGNKTTVFIADLQAGYLVNPQMNLKVFVSYIYRSFDPTQETETAFRQSTNWISLGLRADIFNWYFDY